MNTWKAGHVSDPFSPYQKRFLKFVLSSLLLFLPALQNLLSRGSNNTSLFLLYTPTPLNEYFDYFPSLFCPHIVFECTQCVYHNHCKTNSMYRRNTVYTCSKIVTLFLKLSHDENIGHVQEAWTSYCKFYKKLHEL